MRIDEAILMKARKEQEQIASLVLCSDDRSANYDSIIGVDVAYKDDNAFACAVVMSRKTGKVLGTQQLTTTCDTPYISGYFYLREGPILIRLIHSLKHDGVFLIDGNGQLHPRRMGLASYVGVKLDVVTIGIAKRLMMGTIGKRHGAIAPVIHEGTQIGTALWLDKARKPVFVSVGHRISLRSAVGIVMEVSVGGVPLPLHMAHLCSIGLRGETRPK